MRAIKVYIKYIQIKIYKDPNDGNADIEYRIY